MENLDKKLNNTTAQLQSWLTDLSVPVADLNAASLTQIISLLILLLKWKGWTQDSFPT